jgi:hypothetical protein
MQESRFKTPLAVTKFVNPKEISKQAHAGKRISIEESA